MSINILKKYGILSICLICPLFHPYQAFGKLQSNLAIIDSMLINVLSTKLSSLATDKTDTLIINVQRIGVEKGSYFSMVCGNEARKKSFQVYRNYNSSSSFDGLVLDLDLFTINVTYSEPFTETLFGPSFTTRNINITVRGQFFQTGSGLVRDHLDEQRFYIDEIKYNDIKIVEKSSYSFTNGTRKDYSFIDKIFEPALAITSVALIVYLFFSQRT